VQETNQCTGRFMSQAEPKTWCKNN
jgi:hypothetical protein